MPASRALSTAPRRISPSTAAGNAPFGNPTELKAANGRASHRVDVAERVGGGDRAKVVRPVDDRREEIGRQDQRQIVAQPVHSRVVGRGMADQHVRILDRRQASQDRKQVVRCLFGRAAARLANWVRRIESSSDMAIARNGSSAPEPNKYTDELTGEKPSRRQ